MSVLKVYISGGWTYISVGRACLIYIRPWVSSPVPQNRNKQKPKLHRRDTI